MLKKFLSLGFLGNLPASGTFGSAAGTLFYLAVPDRFRKWLLTMIVFSQITLVHMQKDLNEEDPGWIIIDEFCGVILALYLCRCKDVRSALRIFLAFRFFDILKIPPVNFMERIPGGTGILADDLMAGVYAALLEKAWKNHFCRQ